MKTHSLQSFLLLALVCGAVALGFSSSARAQSSVDVFWSANPEFDIAGYRVHMGTAQTNLSVVETVTGGTRARLHGLQPGTTYHFAVQAFNSAGLSSELSTVESFTTLPAAVVLAPAISIQRADGSVLENHNSQIDLGSAVSGTSGSWETFTITNFGTADLTGLGISLGGNHPADFQLSTTRTVSLAPGASTLFEVVFKPSGEGFRDAVVSVVSNDPDQSPFVLAVGGEGTVVPIVTEPVISVLGAEGFHFSPESQVPFGAVDLGPSSSSRIFTIRNSGSAELSDLSAHISGNQAADFKVSAWGASTLAPGQTTTLTVTFKPLATGSREAQLQILSNDSDNSPFQLALDGIGVGHPEITVTQSAGSALGSGSAVLAFGGVDLGTTSGSQTITITNTGTANLSGVVGSLGGTNGGDFILTGPAISVLSPGASTTVNVAFRPTGAGSRVAKMQIASNDADENPFEILLSGGGVAHPEIAVVKADGGNLIGGSASLTFGSVGLGFTGVPQTLTIRNTGTGNLSGLAVVVEGSQAADFTVSGPAVQTLAPGGSTTLTVNFKPGSAGSRSASMRVASNDADENPFVIQVSGIGVASPEIAVTKSDAGSLVDGGAGLSFGALNLSAAGVSQTLTIHNAGTANLTGIQASVDGSHAADFKITGTPASSLTPGGSTSLTVVFKPLAIGSRSAFLRIVSNDADENPFDVSLGGSGFGVPLIAVQKADLSPIANGGSMGFGSLDLGPASTSQTFTIRNLGNGDLSGLALSVTGNHVSDFSHSTLSSSVLAPGGSLAFTVTFKPLAGGQRSAMIRIASNDASANPYEIALSGSGIAHPEIEVESQIAGKFVSGSSNLAFGITNLGFPSSPQTLTLRNTGTGNLVGIVPTLTGANAADFIISNPGTATLTPGASTSLSVTFRPSAGGFRSATLLIASNDADENPFVIELGGSGISLPEINVVKSDQSPLMAGGTLLFDAAAPGAAASTQTFSIRNTGNADLSGLSLSLTGSHAHEFSASALTSTTIPARGAQTFTLRFSPLSGGTRTARLRITSNDADEGNFDIFVFGTGTTLPDIALEKAGGGKLPTRVGRLDFGPGNLGSADTQSVIIRNQGNGNLNLGSLTVSGPHAADFSATVPSVGVLAPGAHAVVAVAFKPVATGTRSALMRIFSNDPDSSPYEFQLGGSGVPVPRISIASGTVPNLVSGTSVVPFTAARTGSLGSSQTFTIRNTGAAELMGVFPQITGVHAADFSVLSAPASRIAPGTSTTLIISFKPVSPGLRQAVLRISGNDARQPVFLIPLVGQGIAQPEISLFDAERNELPQAVGNVEFGQIRAGGSGLARTITVRNTGSAPLQSLKLGRLVPGRSPFSIGKIQKSFLMPGESVNLTVTFKPKKAGKEAAELRIYSSDSDEDPYILKFAGTGTAAPAIEIKRNPGGTIKAGKGAVSFGSTTAQTRRITRNFTVVNKGNAPLVVSSASLIGADAADFKITGLSRASIPPRASRRFSVHFDPRSGGNKSASLRIASNSVDQPAFIIQVSGSAKSPPKPKTDKAGKGSKGGKSTKGGKKSAIIFAASPSAADSAPRPILSIVRIEGRKYRCITLHKSRFPGINPRRIEVSSDLLDWSSGSRHTTVLVNSPDLLKVRDNTPFTADSKRFIRIRKTPEH